MATCKKCGGDKFIDATGLHEQPRHFCVGCGVPLEPAEMALARETAALCADLFMLAGSCITAPLPELMVIAKGNQVQIGLCGAAVALRELLKRDELGSVALRDLVHKPGFHDVQGE